MFGHHKLPNTMNFSLGLQHQVWGTVIDASYVGSLSRHLFLRTNLNPIADVLPLRSGATRTRRNRAPLPDNFFRPYRVRRIFQYQNIGDFQLQFAAGRDQPPVQERIAVRMAYTYSKALGTASGDGTIVSLYFNVRGAGLRPTVFRPLADTGFPLYV